MNMNWHDKPRTLGFVMSDLKASAPPSIHLLVMELESAIAAAQGEQFRRGRNEGFRDGQQAGRDLEAARRVAEGASATPRAAQVPEAYTTGHCDQHRKPGGCTLHNLQCGYPGCDRRPLAAAQAQGVGHD